MDIVSVNAHMGLGKNQVVKVVVAVVVASVLIIGSMMAVKQWHAHQQAAQAKEEQHDKSANKPAQVGQRRTFDTDALALNVEAGSGSRGRGRSVVPEIEPLPGEGARAIPPSSVPAGSTNGTATGTTPVSRFGGDLIVPSTGSTTEPKTQHDEPTPQSEALGMLRQLVSARMNDGSMAAVDGMTTGGPLVDCNAHL